MEKFRTSAGCHLKWRTTSSMFARCRQVWSDLPRGASRSPAENCNDERLRHGGHAKSRSAGASRTPPGRGRSAGRSRSGGRRPVRSPHGLDRSRSSELPIRRTSCACPAHCRISSRPGAAARPLGSTVSESEWTCRVTETRVDRRDRASRPTVLPCWSIRPASGLNRRRMLGAIRAIAEQRRLSSSTARGHYSPICPKVHQRGRNGPDRDRSGTCPAALGPYP